MKQVIKQLIDPKAFIKQGTFRTIGTHGHTFTSFYGAWFRVEKNGIGLYLQLMDGRTVRSFCKAAGLLDEYKEIKEFNKKYALKDILTLHSFTKITQGW